MSRFAILKSSGSDEENENPLQVLSPQYSFQQILTSFKPSSISQPSQEITQHTNVYSKEILSPECNNFKPPTSDINSTITQQNSANLGKRAGNAQNIVQKRSGKQSLRSRQKSGDFSAAIQNGNLQQYSDEELANSWYYKDPTGFILGPYSSSLMKQWFEKRFLHSSVLVCQGTKDGPFKRISTLFSDMNRVFEPNIKNVAGEKVEIQKPVHIETRVRSERKLNTLFSFSIDEKEEDLLEYWEKTEIPSFTK